MIVNKYNTPNILCNLRLTDAWISNQVCDGIHYRKEDDVNAKKCIRYYIDENFDGLSRIIFINGMSFRFSVSLIYYCADENFRGKSISCHVNLETIDDKQYLFDERVNVFNIDFFKYKRWNAAKLFEECKIEFDKINLEGWIKFINTSKSNA